ncbi:EamA family transporter, partial [Agrobacterium sp. MCAB5]
IGVVHTGGVYMLLYNALPKLSTPLAAVLLFFYPATAIVVDAIVYGHRLGLAQYGGVGCILIASLGVTLKWGVRRHLSVSAT